MTPHDLPCWFSDAITGLIVCALAVLLLSAIIHDEENNGGNMGGFAG